LQGFIKKSRDAISLDARDLEKNYRTNKTLPPICADATRISVLIRVISVITENAAG
jgi:hypothetical protein